MVRLQKYSTRTKKKEYYLRQYHVQFSDAKVNIIMNQCELKAIARDQCQARENAGAQLVLVLVELVARPSKTFEAKPKQYSDQLKTNSFVNHVNFLFVMYRALTYSTVELSSGHLLISGQLSKSQNYFP